MFFLVATFLFLPSELESERVLKLGSNWFEFGAISSRVREITRLTVHFQVKFGPIILSKWAFFSQSPGSQFAHCQRMLYKSKRASAKRAILSHAILLLKEAEIKKIETVSIIRLIKQASFHQLHFTSTCALSLHTSALYTLDYIWLFLSKTRTSINNHRVAHVENQFLGLSFNSFCCSNQFASLYFFFLSFNINDIKGSGRINWLLFTQIDLCATSRSLHLFAIVVAQRQY